MNRMILWILPAFVLVACTTVDYREVRMKEVERYFETMQGKVLPRDKVFTLEDCVKTALENNLDLSIARRREEIEGEKTTGAMLSMLPDLYVSYNGTARDNEPGASSESLKTGKLSLEPSKSTEKRVNSFKIELLLGLLDFGLAYFNSLQAHDQVKASQEETRRTAQNITFDVAKAYYTVAVAQHGMEATERLIQLYEKMEESIKNLESEKTISPLKAVESRIGILRFNQQLREYQRTYENSRIQLVSLMGYSPAHAVSLKVDTSILDNIPNWHIPSIDKIERAALENRPELYQMDIDSHIALLETRKALLMMFPNVQLVGEFNHSSNKYLYNQSWWEMGIKAAYNLLKLPAHYKVYQTKTMESDLMKDKMINLSLGILAQVRIAYFNFQDIRDRYQISDNIYKLSRSRYELIQGKYQGEGAKSAMEVLQAETEAHLENLDRLSKLGNLFVAYHRLLNTVGTSSLPRH